MADEAKIQADIMLACGSRRDVRLFRNQVGSGWSGQVVQQDGDVVVLRNARFVRYGLAPGSADLVGWQTLVVTPEMVGQRVAVFASVEVKAVGGRVADEQTNWAARVVQAGGRAGIARSVEQANAILLPPEESKQ